MQNHYFNKQGYYTYSGYANPQNARPLTATRKAPDFREGLHPKWNGTVWENVQDMRGTKYYMPDGSEHEITEVEGVLPEGASFEKPELALSTSEELVLESIDAVQQKIAANDLASVGLLRAKVAGTATKEEEEELIALDQRAKKLKAELAALTD